MAVNGQHHAGRTEQCDRMTDQSIAGVLLIPLPLARHAGKEPGRHRDCHIALSTSHGARQGRACRAQKDLFREKIRAVANAIHWFPKLYEITHHNWWEEATIGPFVAYTPT